MHPANTTDEIIAVVQAYKEGKKIQSRGRTVNQDFEDCIFEPLWDFDSRQYRVKPDPVITRGYRRYIGKYWDGTTYIVGICYAHNSPPSVESSKDFVRWIDTEWQTHEV